MRDERIERYEKAFLVAKRAARIEHDHMDDVALRAQMLVELAVCDLSTFDLALACSCTLATTRRAVADLRHEGRIERVDTPGRVVWRLVE